MNEEFSGAFPHTLARQVVIAGEEEITMRSARKRADESLFAKISDAITQEWGCYAASDSCAAFCFDQFVNQVHWQLYYMQMKK